MWQYVVVFLAVTLSALYVARALGPRSWRRRSGTRGHTGVAADDAGAAVGGGCSNCSAAQKRSSHPLS